MPAGAEFRQILDEKLAAAEAVSSRPPATDAWPTWGTIPDPFSAFAGCGRPFAAGGVAHAARSAYSGPAWSKPRPSPPRRLSSVQQRALDCLREFGAAALDDSFTPADIKRAFRLLARRFHPDCHPDADEAERAYLARSFARIAAAYRQLVVPTLS